MGYYTVLSVVDDMLIRRQWKLHHCRRQGDDNLRYYLTGADGRVLTANGARRRLGLTLPELLAWLGHCGDQELSSRVPALWQQMGYAA